MADRPLFSDEFREDLRVAINRNSVDAAMRIPDYILVDYLLDNLAAIRAMHHALDEYGDI